MSQQYFSLNDIVQCLQQEEVIAYPAEAVFGLGCDPDSQQAVEKLLRLKQRSWEKGLILIAANYQQLSPYIDESLLSTELKERIFSTWPGPVTWVMPALASTPRWLTGRFDSIAVRVSAHPLVQQLCLTFGKAVVSTSANLSGQPACRTVQQVQAQFGEQFPILVGETTGRARPSEIRDALTGDIVRQG